MQYKEEKVTFIILGMDLSETYIGMKIIDEIIEELINKDKHLTDILIKSKVLAFKLKNSELSNWIENELNGYPTNKLPDYRILTCQIIGTLSNGYHRATNYPIPLIGLEKETTNAMKTVLLAQSISTLDEFVQDKKGNKLIMNVPPELYGYLSKDLDNGFVIEVARREVDKVQIIQTLTAIRTKLLDFLLELNEELGDIEDLKPNTIVNSKDKVASLFHSTVFGNNTTIIVGDNNTQTVTNVVKGDFGTLEKRLIEGGISKAEIKELETVIDIDDYVSNKNEFGTKVKSWVAKMLAKAMDGSWQIGLGAAGSLLADSIERYYGWK